MAPKGVFVRTAECNRINAESKKKSYADGRIPFNRGIKFSEEHKQKMAVSKIGKNNPKWKGGITQLYNQERKINNYKIVLWRKQILFRDDFTCQNPNCPHCLNVKTLSVVAHHIKSFHNFRNLRYKIENGITYCKKYHDSLPKKPFNDGTKSVSEINKMSDKQKLRDIGDLLCSWEDGNINDYEFTNKVGGILGLGNWTFKGADPNIE